MKQTLSKRISTETEEAAASSRWHDRERRREKKKATGKSSFCIQTFQFQAVNNQCPVRMSMLDPETREGYGQRFIESSNPAIGESSQIPVMQNLQRSKRQNCGSTMQGHHAAVSGSSSSLQNMEAEGGIDRCPGPSVHAGHHGSSDHGNRRQNFQIGQLEPGISGFSSLPSNEGSSSRESHWNSNLPGSDPENAQYPHNRSFMNHLHSYPHLASGNRIPCKRKSSMDNVAGSQLYRPSGSRDADSVRYNEPSGLSRAEISGTRSTGCASTSTAPVWDDQQYCRGSDMHMSERVNSFHCPPSSSSNQYRARAAILPREVQQSSSITAPSRISSSAPAWIPRRMVGNENIPEADVCVSQPLSINQNNSSSGGFEGSSSFAGVNMNRPAFVSGMPRDFHTGIYMGNHANGPPSWIGVPPDGILQNSYEHSRIMPAMPSRAVPLRDNSLHSCHVFTNPYTYPGSRTPLYHVPVQPSRRSQAGLVPFPPMTCINTNNVIQRSQMTYGDVYPPFPAFSGPAVTGFFPGSLEGGRPSSIQNGYRVPFRSLQVTPPADGANRQRFSSHDMFDRSHVYNGLDIHDQHSNLRLDVDNMSYEELLALEERIGNVCTGLSEDALKKCLVTAKYSSIDVNLTSAVLSHDSEVKCSICQEDYTEGEEMGKLGCGHGYHTACIKQWLVLKNLCPICKTAAYSDC